MAAVLVNMERPFGQGFKSIERKKVPSHKMGRLWKFKASQVDAWGQTGNAAETKIDGK